MRRRRLAFRPVLAVDYKLNFITPAQGDALRAVGLVLRAGRTLSVCHLDVFSMASGEERLCSMSLHTVIRLDDRSDHASGEKTHTIDRTQAS